MLALKCKNLVLMVTMFKTWLNMAARTYVWHVKQELIRLHQLLVVIHVQLAIFVMEVQIATFPRQLKQIMERYVQKVTSALRVHRNQQCVRQVHLIQTLEENHKLIAFCVQLELLTVNMELQAVNHVGNSLPVLKGLNNALVLVKIEHIQLKIPHVDALQVLISKTPTVLVKVNLVLLQIVSRLFMITVVQVL
jgi:hypothetical protein